MRDINWAAAGCWWLFAAVFTGLSYLAVAFVTPDNSPWPLIIGGVVFVCFAIGFVFALIMARNVY